MEPLNVTRQMLAFQIAVQPLFIAHPLMRHAESGGGRLDFLWASPFKLKIVDTQIRVRYGWIRLILNLIKFRIIYFTEG
jgi:hypothetical protein